MFRMKKSAANGVNGANGAERIETAEEPSAEAPPIPEAAEAKSTPRRPVAQPVRALPPSATLEIHRRGHDAAAPTRAESAPAPARERTLVVGKEVTLSGEIATCERLVVEGSANVTASGCQRLHIGPTGVFRGKLEVAEAEVLGVFEGDLVVTGQLIVRPGGLVSGKVRYRTLSIEAGGQIMGEVVAIEGAARAAATADGESVRPLLARAVGADERPQPSAHV